VRGGAHQAPFFFIAVIVVFLFPLSFSPLVPRHIRTLIYLDSPPWFLDGYLVWLGFRCRGAPFLGWATAVVGWGPMPCRSVAAWPAFFLSLFLPREFPPGTTDSRKGRLERRLSRLPRQGFYDVLLGGRNGSDDPSNGTGIIFLNVFRCACIAHP